MISQDQPRINPSPQAPFLVGGRPEVVLETYVPVLIFVLIVLGLIGALGGCTGLNAVLLLKKFKQPLRSLEVEVEGDREEEWPKAFKRIELTFHCTWDGDIDKKLVEQAIDLACNRYCPIHATLSHGVKIEHHRKDLH